MRDFIWSMMTDQGSGLGVRFGQAVLWLCSIAYGVIVRGLRFFYSSGVLPSVSLPRPVVCVGNLTIGGSGKTPMVEWLARGLARRGLRPAVLTRGYMPHAQAPATSDEAAELGEALPGITMAVNPDRSAGAREALGRGEVDLFIMDDGFQHWRVRRDCDVVVIDAMSPFGNRHVLPRGILREPIGALVHADVFVITRSDLAPEGAASVRAFLKKTYPGRLIMMTRHQPVAVRDLSSGKEVGLEVLKGQRVCAVASIGNPVGFYRTIERLGVDIVDRYERPDHHVYTAAEVDALCSGQGDRIFITTMKDAVKLRGIVQERSAGQAGTWYALKIEIRTDDGEELFKKICGLAGR